MKKIFTNLFCLLLLTSVIHIAQASNSAHASSVCPTLDDVNFPDNLIISDLTLDFTTLLYELSPDSIMQNYGFSEYETIPTFQDPDECGNLATAYTDVIININNTTFKVLRQWTTLDWFTAEIREQYQIILVNTEPQSYCAEPIVLSVNPWSCEVNGINPEAFLVSGNDYQNVTMDPDPTTVFDIGTHSVTVTATLGSEDITCYGTLIVVDNTPPVAISEIGVQVALDENCTATITPELLDNGSHDGDCGGVTLSVEPSTFTAEDAGTTITVTLHVVDEAGNSNFTWSNVEILPCSGASVFQCIQVVSIADLNEAGVQLYAEDFLTSSTTHSGDLTLTITDPAGNVINDGFIPQGAGGSFLYNVTDNVSGESCTGVIQAPLAYDPCSAIACALNVNANLSETGSITLFPEDFLVNAQDCPSYTIEIFDENSNSIASGTSVTLNQADTYLYQVTNGVGNLCWATLTVGEYVPCPTTIVCNDNINVSMYTPSGSTTPIATITPDMLLEANTIGCNLNEYNIEISDTGIAGYYFEGVGSVDVNQPSQYVYTITDPVTGNSCFGSLNIENFATCPGLSSVTFPANLDLTIVGITQANIFTETAPSSLIDNYGYTNEQTRPSWPEVSSCNNLFSTYSDQLFNYDNDSFRILRTWTVLDWLTGNLSTDVQIIDNNINLGLICDFLPNSAEFGDCDSGHTQDDDVEWPDDLSIADYRIKPGELVDFSGVDPLDAQPIIVDNHDIYDMDYVDILKQLEVNSITINRVWTVTANNSNIATYTQEIVVDISGFASLVAVNTMTNRPVSGVEVESNGTNLTNEVGVAFTENPEQVEPSYEDFSYNGVTILDIVRTQQHILGLDILNNYQLMAADINKNSTVSAIDLIQMNKTILEIPIGIESEWFFVEAQENENAINPSRDLIAIKSGDVDDDAYLGTPSSFTSRDLLVEDALINNGEQYEVKMQYSGNDLIHGMEVHMYYDPSLITPDSLSIVNVPQSVDYNLDIPGEIHFTLRNTSALEFLFTGENYITLDFTAKSNGLFSQAILGTAPRNSYVINLDFELVQLDFEFVTEISTGTQVVTDHMDVFKVYPNPAYDNINFDFIGETPQNYSIYLYNINGQLISEHTNENNLDLSSLSSGMHFYRVIQDGNSYAGRFEVIK